MYPEEEYLPISSLQHLLFCERQFALIFIERQWDENLFTVEGKLLHSKVDSARAETRQGVRTAFGLLLKSDRLGLFGKADVIEFHLIDKNPNTPFKSNLPHTFPDFLKKGLWQAYPVEYKRGKPKPQECDAVQLCAQAICLEEMLNINVPMGAVFYGKTRRRKEFVFDRDLRALTEKTSLRAHELFKSGITPKAQYSKSCESCSIKDLCLPGVMDGSKSVKEYIAKMLVQE
jgi:CRISPR-associated exonuclease Cas4